MGRATVKRGVDRLPRGPSGPATGRNSAGSEPVDKAGPDGVEADSPWPRRRTAFGTRLVLE